MKISFIGGGTMAQAMISGILENKLATREDISIGERVESRREFLEKQFRINVFPNNSDATKGSDLIILSVKPQDLDSVFGEIRKGLQTDQIVMSIVAGASMSKISQGLEHPLIVRVMPNAPSQIGKGMSVWIASAEIPSEKLEIVQSILESLGEQWLVRDEKYMDMATALSASGPAYVWLFLEALVDGGVHIGLPREMAEALALQTAFGSIVMAKSTGRHPADLRDLVTSPGGTTTEGLLVLKEDGFQGTIIQAIVAAYEKAQDLGGS